MGKPVALFITCLTDQFYPQVGIAVTRVLEHFGCDVQFPDAQTCCGQPFYNNGYTDEARTLARRFIEQFEHCEQIVTPSASCCAMVRQEFPRILEDDPAYEHGLKHVVARTYEFVEFLTGVLKIDFRQLALPEPQVVTYHYNCHLRALGVPNRTPELLGRMGNVEYRALEKADQCCGFGGTFALKYPAVSGAMTRDKVECIAATQASTTLCNDGGCAMNISGMCQRQGVQTRVRHFAELIADALGIDCTAW